MTRHLLALAYACVVVIAVWAVLLPGEAWAAAYRVASAVRRMVAS